MLLTYQAVLIGDRLEWVEAAPPLPRNGEGVRVYVTILPEVSPENEDALVERKESLRYLLEELAELNIFAGVDDPVAWQREIRRDRTLAWDE